MRTTSRAVLMSEGPATWTQSASRTGSMSVPLMNSSHCGMPRKRYPMRAPTGCCRITSALITRVTRFTSAWIAAPTIAFGPASATAAATAASSEPAPASRGGLPASTAGGAAGAAPDSGAGSPPPPPRSGTEPARRRQRGSRELLGFVVGLVLRLGRRGRRLRGRRLRGQDFDGDHRLPFHVFDLEAVGQLEGSDRVVRGPRREKAQYEGDAGRRPAPEMLRSVSPSPLACERRRRGVRCGWRCLRRALSERSAPGLTLDHAPSLHLAGRPHAASKASEGERGPERAAGMTRPRPGVHLPQRSGFPPPRRVTASWALLHVPPARIAPRYRLTCCAP